MGKTQINWGFESFQTWNPQEGCTRISPGCEHCYAEKYAGRFCEVEDSQLYGIAKRTPSGSRWTGMINRIEWRLNEPLRHRKPTVYFVNSRSDTFHGDVSDVWIDRLFAVMAFCRDHRFLVLTKHGADKHERMKAYLSRLSQSIVPLEAVARQMGYTFNYQGIPLLPWPIRNVGLGVSVENKKELRRIDVLRDTPAEFRFLSLEPLLEDLGELDLRGIDWVIVGGESGKDARVCRVEWIREIVRQCRGARVPCFLKQLGSHVGSLTAETWSRKTRWRAGIHPFGHVIPLLHDSKGEDPEEWPEQLRVRQIPEGFLRQEVPA